MTRSIASRDALIPSVLVSTPIAKEIANSAMLHACRQWAATVDPERLTVSEQRQVSFPV
jgi:hypothetical protein